MRTLSSMSLREEMWRRMAPESSAIGTPERRPPAAELFVDNPQKNFRASLKRKTGFPVKKKTPGLIRNK